MPAAGYRAPVWAPAAGLPARGGGLEGHPDHVYEDGDALPHNLPLQLTSFVGRGRELAAVLELLTNYRLVTLTGPGGPGTTRLALQAARAS